MFSNIRLITKCWNSSNHLRVNTTVTITRIQQYSDWFHRQPVKIVNEEEILEYAQAAEGPNEYLDAMKPITRKPLKERPKKIKYSRKNLKATTNDALLKEGGKLNFTEVKENDGILLSLMMSVRSRKERDKKSRIILEGYRLITDAIESGAKPEIIVFSRNDDALSLPLPERGIKLFKAPYRSIQTWSTLVTSPGIMGFFKMPNTEVIEPPPNALPLTIICDNVRDPGNMGSILRAVAAVGCKKLITVKGCVDIWDPKVLKTAAGAHFRTTIFASKTWDETNNLIDPFASYFIADNNILTKFPKEEEKVVEQFKKREKNKPAETKAATPEAATSEESVEENIDDSDDNSDDELDNKMKEVNKDETKADDVLEEILENENRNQVKNAAQRLKEAKLVQRLTKFIPVVPYYGADYTTEETVIIVGGETEGISIEALELVHKKLGIRVNIPMTNAIESLNTSMALGIIIFEVKRQHATKRVKDIKSIENK